MQPERLLTQIARCYGLPDAKDENLQRLEERFKMLRNRGTVPVLLIDDAQELPPTSLITLLRLYERQAGGAPLVSLVLFANDGELQSFDLVDVTVTDAIPGDFDGDGDVDGADFLKWQAGFPTASGATRADGDADGDGDVDGQDFLIWQGNYPTPAP